MDGLTKNRRLVTKRDSAAAPFLFPLAVDGRSEEGSEGGTVAAKGGTAKIKVESRSLASPLPPSLRLSPSPGLPAHLATTRPRLSLVLRILLAAPPTSSSALHLSRGHQGDVTVPDTDLNTITINTFTSFTSSYLLTGCE